MALNATVAIAAAVRVHVRISDAPHRRGRGRSLRHPATMTSQEWSHEVDGRKRYRGIEPGKGRMSPAVVSRCKGGTQAVATIPGPAKHTRQYTKSRVHQDALLAPSHREQHWTESPIARQPVALHSNRSRVR